MDVQGNHPPLSDASSGRIIVLLAAVILVGVDIYSDAFSLILTGPRHVLAQAIRFLLTGLLGVAFYRGSRAARWITVGLLTLGIVYGAPSLFRAAGKGSIMGIAMLGGMLCGYLTVLLLLVVPKPVRAFYAGPAKQS